jgi:glycosyltransferase involved in cell wall biosynthesis
VPRVIYLNNYPTEQAIEACAIGQLPRNHLWGIDHLERLGCGVDVVPFTWSPRAQRLSRLAGGRLGELDRQAVAWRLRRGADLVYAASAEDVPALAALRLTGALSVPLAAFFFHPPTHPAWHALFRGVDLELCLSSRTERQLRERFRVPAERAVTVPWGPDLGYAEFQSPPPLGDRVVSTGKTRRDHATLLAALKLAGLPATVLIHDATDDRPLDQGAAGAGSARRSSPEHADLSALRLTAGPHTRLLPVTAGTQLPRTDVTAVLASSRVVAVIASEEIGVNGLTETVEALALGRPVVMTRNRYFDLDVEAAGCGRVVDAGDVSGLAQAFVDVWSDPERAAAMGAAGRRHLEEHLDYRTFGRDLARALRRVAPIPKD